MSTSKKILNTLWWGGYLVIGILLQRFFPGCDALTPGFLLALQERRPWQTFWLFLIFVLLQEGTGSLNFGMGVLWFGGLVILFYISSRHFMAENIFFIAFLSLTMSLYQGFLLWFMAALQDISLDYINIVQKSVFQVLLIPIVWGLAWLVRPKVFRHGNRS